MSAEHSDNLLFPLLRDCEVSEPYSNSDRAIESDDHSGQINSAHDLLSQPLYCPDAERLEIEDPEELDACVQPFTAHEILNGLHIKGVYFAFWVDWFWSQVEGSPLPWDLQEKIALIPDDIWEAGPEAVAAEIEDIRKRFDVTSAARDVEEYLTTQSDDAISSANPMIGHNQPPEDERLPLDPPQMDQLLATVQFVQVLAQAPQLDVAALEARVAELEEAKTSIGAWLAEKCDKSAEKFFEELGKWGGRVAVAGLTGAALWFLGLLEKLGPLVTFIQALIRHAIGI